MASSSSVNQAPVQQPVIVDALLAEYKRAEGMIQATLTQSDRIAGLALTLALLAFGIGMKEELHAVLLVMPPAFASIHLYLVAQFEFVALYAGYAASLESRINRLVGSTILMFETEVGPAWTYCISPSTVCMIAAAFVAEVVVIGWCVVDAYAYYSPLVAGVQAVASILLFGMALWRTVRLPKRNRSVRQMCEHVSLCDQLPTSSDGGTCGEP